MEGCFSYKQTTTAAGSTSITCTEAHLPNPRAQPLLMIENDCLAFAMANVSLPNRKRANRWKPRSRPSRTGGLPHAMRSPTSEWRTRLSHFSITAASMRLVSIAAKWLHGSSIFILCNELTTSCWVHCTGPGRIFADLRIETGDGQRRVSLRRDARRRRVPRQGRGRERGIGDIVEAGKIAEGDNDDRARGLRELAAPVTEACDKTRKGHRLKGVTRIGRARSVAVALRLRNDLVGEREARFLPLPKRVVFSDPRGEK